jgi:hypothetical protein
MAKIIKSFTESKRNYFRFCATEETSGKNGDQEFFGIVEVRDYKTWAYFSLNQINAISADYNVACETIDQDVKDLFPCLSGFHYAQSKARAQKHYFNATLIYLVQDLSGAEPSNRYALANRRQKFSGFKKHPFLNLVLDDKQEIFYGKTRQFSYKYSKNFSYPAFNCEFTMKLSRVSTAKNLVEALAAGPVSDSEMKILKKTVLTNLLKGDRECYRIDWHFLGLFETAIKVFGVKALCGVISRGKFESVSLNPILQDFESCILTKNALYDNFVELLNILKAHDAEWAMNIFLRWELSSYKVQNFLSYLRALKSSGLAIQLDRYTGLNYLFNVVSKEYARLNSDNFILQNKNKPDLSRNFPDRFNEYRLVIPPDYKTLTVWGAYLHNCAGNFEQRDYYSETLNIGLMKDGNIQYLVSIKDGYLSQFKGFKNSAPPEEMYRGLLSHLQDLNVVYVNSEKECDYRACCVQRR